MGLIPYSRSSGLLGLEDVLQRELHDSRIQCVSYLAELSGAQIGGNRTCPETVQDVERFGAKLEALRFTHAERAGNAMSNCHVKGSFKMTRPALPRVPSAGCAKCRRVQVLGQVDRRRNSCTSHWAKEYPAADC